MTIQISTIRIFYTNFTRKIKQKYHVIPTHTRKHKNKTRKNYIRHSHFTKSIEVHTHTHAHTPTESSKEMTIVLIRQERLLRVGTCKSTCPSHLRYKTGFIEYCIVKR